MAQATSEEYFVLGKNDAAEYENDQDLLKSKVVTMKDNGVSQERIDAYIKGFNIGTIVSHLATWEQSDLVEAFEELLPEVNEKFLADWFKRQQG